MIIRHKKTFTSCCSGVNIFTITYYSNDIIPYKIMIYFMFLTVYARPLKKGHFVSQCFAKSKCNLCHRNITSSYTTRRETVLAPLIKAKTKKKVTASTMIGDGSTSFSGLNQDHVRVSANVMTTDGGTFTAFTFDQATSETPILVRYILQLRSRRMTTMKPQLLSEQLY